MKEPFKSFNKMKTSQEYKIYKRLETLVFTWNLCKSNEEELFEIINELEQSVNLELYPIYDGVIGLLSRRLINHVGTTKLFVDHIRNENKYLTKSNNGIAGYKDKIDECFAHNPVIQFVNELRNNLIHYMRMKPEMVSHILNEELNISILIVKTNILLKSKSWNKYSKIYIAQNKPQINLKSCLLEYSRLQEYFYHWFIEEYRKKYINEISYCEKAINNHNAFFDEKKEIFENMSLAEMLSLPRLECTYDTGFTISRVD
jgi:hypothetical protein